MISRLLAAALGLLLVQSAQGEIVIDRTRLIYPVGAREVTVNLRNVADSARLVQVWIDEGDGVRLPEYSDVPFTVTPPILRLEAGRARALRVAWHAQAGATADREVLYWLNVLGIRPASETDNTLQFAFRTRIKLFLRPAGLPERADEAAQALQWEWLATGLKVRNPGAYHVTLSSLVLSVDGMEHRLENPPMLAPRSSTRLNSLPDGRQGAAILRFTTLDDHGTTRHHEVRL